MTSGHRRDADKSRQELLDEIYYLRDVAGEREQRAGDLQRWAGELENRLVAITAALRGVLHSRSWRMTRPLRRLLHWERGGDMPDAMLAELVASEGPQGSAEQPIAHVSKHVQASARPVRRSSSASCLFVDVSELAFRQGQTGIQRVVREISRALLTVPPDGFTVELVYVASGGPYRYARTFADSLMGKTVVPTLEGAIEVRPGDLFLGLDHAMDAVLERVDELAAMRTAGVKLCFVLNDTLPLSRPDWFPPDVSAAFKRWFETISRIGDRIVCISQSTEADAREWLDRLQVPREERPALGSFHLGADNLVEDIDATVITPDQRKVLERLRGTTSFLMVGTLEPRKGHAQTLEAFNRLWAEGEDVVLMLVGRPGWMTEVTQRRIRHHDEFGQRLFWFMDASDALLDKLYGTCTVLLAPSEGEGFGLPLVEAARHNLPILCRDLSVFREVAGEHAVYFSGLDPASLANAIRDWLDARQQGVIPASSQMPWLRWGESAGQLVALILGNQSGRTS